MNGLINVETLNLLFWLPNKCQIMNVYINFAVKYNTITVWWSFYTEAIFFLVFRRRKKKEKKKFGCNTISWMTGRNKSVGSEI